MQPPPPTTSAHPHPQSHGHAHHHHPHHPTINNASDALPSAVCGGPFPSCPPTIRNSLICFLIKQVLDLQLLGCCVCSVLCVCHCLLLSFNFAFKRFAPSASKGCVVKGSRGQHIAYSESWFRSCCQKCVRSSLHSTFWTADRRTKDRRPCVVIFHFVHNPRPSVALPKFVYVEKSDIPVGKQSVRGRGTGSGGREVLEVEGKGQAASSGSGN